MYIHGIKGSRDNSIWAAVYRSLERGLKVVSTNSIDCVVMPNTTHDTDTAQQPQSSQGIYPTLNLNVKCNLNVNSLVCIDCTNKIKC